MIVYIVNSYVYPPFRIDRVSINKCFSTREEAEDYLKNIVTDGDIQDCEISSFDNSVLHRYQVSAVRFCQSDADLTIPVAEFIESLIFIIELLSDSGVEPEFNSVSRYLPPGGSRGYYDSFLVHYVTCLKSKNKGEALETGKSIIGVAITNNSFINDGDTDA
jgi:hypothetical protein